MGRPSPKQGPTSTEADRVRTLFDFAVGTFGDEFRPDDAYRSLGGDPHVLEFFVPWALYHYQVRGQSVAWHYHDAMVGEVPVLELVAFIPSAGALLSIWEVMEARPGEGLHLRDLVAGSEFDVTERTASRALRRWQVVLARVSCNRDPQIFGLHPRTLPPRQGAIAAEEVARALGGRPGRAAKSRLGAPEAADLLVRAWEQATFEHYDFTPLPRLVNTDGQPFRPTTDTFEIAAGARGEVAARLKRLPLTVVDEEGPDLLSLSHTRRGNAMNPGWTNTVLGRLELGTDFLTVETNSAVRADSLRRTVEAACAGLLRHIRREERAPPVVPGPGASSTGTPPSLVPLLRDFKRRDYASWLDTPVPALGGHTPREAARNRRRRREVLLLLKEIEHQEEGIPADERCDTAVLWKRLGFDTR